MAEGSIGVARLRRHRPRRVRAFAALVALAIGVLQLVVAGPAQALSGDTRMHDPSVIKVGNCYYGFSTGFERDPLNPSGSITERRTCDTTAASGWTKVRNVWESTPSWITAKLGKTPPNIWAPEIKYFNHRFHLYYGASVWGTAYAVMGLATATNIAGPWTDRGIVTDVNYPIDPDVEVGADGRLYVAWGSFTGDGIFMHVLNPATGKLSTTDSNLWHLATGMEGATFLRDGKYFYLLGSEGGCCSGTNSTYYTVVGRATTITGPYLDQNGVDLTAGGGTTVLRGAWPKVAAGGADAFEDDSPDPFWRLHRGKPANYLAYHYYDADNSGQETLDIRRVTFANGWPIFAAPLGSANNHLLNGNSGLCADVWYLSTADDAAVNQGNCNSGSNQQWVLTRVGSNYRLANVNSGKCLTIYGSSTTDGAAAVQRTCDTGAGQLWKKVPTIGGYVTLTNVNSGQCLEVYGATSTNGAGMNQWPCNGGTNQQWLIV
jgi:arabinan endo-1,5-alpha-L-arabinosidase